MPTHLPESTVPKIQWIAAVYGLTDPATGGLRDRIGVPASGHKYLLELIDHSIRHDSLVALYLPQNTPIEYPTEGKRGRIIGLTSVCPIPKGKQVEDYAFPDTHDNKKWPIGFPCEIVCCPDRPDCPDLREIVEASGDVRTFRNYTKMLRDGPVQVSSFLQAALGEHFARLKPFTAIDH
jgi:hypothetical protein